MADNRVAYGLAKKYGIDTKGMSPKEVWDALKDKGISEESYNKEQGEKKQQAEKIYNTDVPTPAESKRLREMGIKDKPRENLSAEERRLKELGIERGKSVAKDVIKTLKTYAGKPEGTYDYKTGEPVSLNDGYMVTFHQNEPDENGHYKSHYGRYTEEEYDKLTNDFAQKNNAEVFVGVFDDEPEISFKVKTREQAKRLAIENNQKSYWNNKKGREWQNKKHYDKTKNPMRGD